MPTAQFDPDAFMAQQSPAAFDPDAFMAQDQQAPSKPMIGPAPAPQGVGGRIAKWAGDASSDLKHGTAVTALGALLQKMGAPGLESGVSPKTAEFMGSAPLGLLQAVQGAGGDHHPSAYRGRQHDRRLG